jgi:hypothetical protein
MFSEGRYLYCHYKESVVGGLSRLREPRRRHRYGQPGASANLQGGTQRPLSFVRNTERSPVLPENHIRA